jgi:hypothetical protein
MDPVLPQRCATWAAFGGPLSHQGAVARGHVLSIATAAQPGLCERDRRQVRPLEPIVDVPGHVSDEQSNSRSARSSQRRMVLIRRLLPFLLAPLAIAPTAAAARPIDSHWTTARPALNSDAYAVAAGTGGGVYLFRPATRPAWRA